MTTFEKNRASSIKSALKIAFFSLGIAFALFLIPHLTFANLISITHTTVSDFNAGTFYHTGLTKDTTGGGDGDGEVRLLTIGISPSKWNQATGNVTGLPAGGLLGHAAAQKNGFIYVSGGQTSGVSTPLSGVYYSQINTTTHNLNNWGAGTALPSGIKFHAMVAVNNFLYVLGGVDSTFAETSTVRFASINPTTGAVGSWSSATSLGARLSDFAAVVVSNTIYVIGGQVFPASSNDTKTVYYATPDPTTGAISAWNTTTASYPNFVSRHTAASYAGVAYGFGGANFPQPPPYYPDVFYASPISGTHDISAWTSTTNLPTNLIYASAVAYAGQVYVAGGAFNNNSTLTNTIASNLVNPDGTLLFGGWTNSNVLSTPRQRTAAVVSDDGWIYVIEGNSSLSGASPLTTIDFGPTIDAGGAAYAKDGIYTSAVSNLGSPYPIQKIEWNTTITASLGLTMSLQYRTGNSSDLSAASWMTPSIPADGIGITNTINFSTTGQYIQYRTMFTSTGGTRTPVLNQVKVYYDVPAPPTTTVPPPTTGTLGPRLPDFAIPDMKADPGNGSATPISYTLNISITNWGNLGFNRAPVLSKTAKVGQQSSKRGVPRQIPDAIRATNAYSGTTNYFFWVDVYVDPSTAPSIPADVGNCPAQGGGINYAWVYALGVGETVNVPIQCYLPGNVAHTYYAQADTCDNPPNVCSPTYGYVLELSEVNNIGGPVLSGQSWHNYNLGWRNPVFLPNASKNGP